MPKELSDHAAADLWRQLSQLIDEGGNLTFEHTASGRTGEVIQCHLIPGKPSSICSIGALLRDGVLAGALFWNASEACSSAVSILGL